MHWQPALSLLLAVTRAQDGFPVGKGPFTAAWASIAERKGGEAAGARLLAITETNRATYLSQVGTEVSGYEPATRMPQTGLCMNVPVISRYLLEGMVGRKWGSRNLCTIHCKYPRTQH